MSSRIGRVGFVALVVACQAPDQKVATESEGPTGPVDAGDSRRGRPDPANAIEAGDAGPGAPTPQGDPSGGGPGSSGGEGPGGEGSAPTPMGGGAGNASAGNPSGGSAGTVAAAGGSTGGSVPSPAGGGGSGGSANAGAGGTLDCEPNEQRCNGNAPQICDADGIWRPLLECEAPQRCVAGECQQPIDEACPLLPTLPRFSGGPHVVDGDGSEFSDIEPVTYELRSAPVVSASYAQPLPTVVTVRMAWSEQAFVAHVRVEDPAIHTYEGGVLEYFWQGDNVQFFIAPTDALTGQYSGTEDGGATHLVIVPPSDTQPSVAIEVFEPCYACVDASLSAVDYAAVAVSGGYEIELSWPWTSPLGTFSPGDRVALNLIVGAQDDPGAGLQLEGLLANNPVDGETPCGGATHPGCDDRTWCYSVLE